MRLKEQITKNVNLSADSIEIDEERQELVIDGESVAYIRDNEIHLDNQRIEWMNKAELAQYMWGLHKLYKLQDGVGSLVEQDIDEDIEKIWNTLKELKSRL